MARTIAEHRKKGTAARKSWHQPVSVTGDDQGDLQLLNAELAELQSELDEMAAPDPDKPAADRRMTDEDPRVAKKVEVDAKKAEIQAILDRANDDLIDLVLQVKHSGEWINWVNAHPPREGRRLDEDWECDMDALAVESMDWVIKASDEPVTGEDVTWLHENVDHGDKHAAALRIVQMQYGGTSVPKSLTGSRSDRVS